MTHGDNRAPQVHPVQATGKRVLLLSVIFLLIGAFSASAQDFSVQGVVIDAETDTPLPGVNIVEVGTTNGTTTDAEGAFALAVAGPDVQLAVSFVGFETETVDVDGQSNLTITLGEDAVAMEEVVVTAFGIEQQRKSLGYSVSKVSGEDLTEAREVNVANSLAGKVAGVTVSKPATGTGGSSRVVIRGATSLGGSSDNQPLYVVDGIPIDNSNLGSAGMWGGSDQGDGISSINPDDIEEVSVLKGAAAAALYGSRAKNGVILITTKTGRNSPGLGVEFNTNTTFEDALVGYSDFQYQYGQGTRGAAPSDAQEARETALSSWGQPIDPSQMVVQFDGVERPYAAIEDKLDTFYDTGVTTTNTLALDGGSETTTFRLSGTYLNTNGIVPNSGLDRLNVTLRGTSEFGSRLSADAKISFAREEVHNRARLSDSPGNANYTVAFLPPNVNTQSLRGNPEDPGRNEEGTELRFSEGIFTTNPYFAAYQFVDNSLQNRFTGFGLLRYEILNGISVQGRVGRDWYARSRRFVEPFGLAYKPEGFISETEWQIGETNADLLFLLDRPLASSLNLSGTLGGNLTYRRTENVGISGDQFIIPELQTVSNTRQQGTGYGFSEKQINSLLGSLELSYNDYAFLRVTGRNDWSSTLPDENNSYFYPSVSGSFVFSDAFAMPAWLGFGKLRASWARVGGDTDPYQLALTYSIIGQGHLNNPLGTVSQGTIPLADLKPYSQVGREVGVDLQMLDDRVGLDFTWYYNSTTNQILSTSISSTSGYGSRIINVGEMQNQGVESLISVTPLRSPRFRWNVDFNFAKNNNKVVALVEGQETLFLGESRTRNAYVVARVGEPYGSILGYRYQRDPGGNLVLDADGLPTRVDSLQVLGNATPSWTGGLTNTFRYKNITLNALVDIQWGGDLYSATNANAYGNGLHKNTLAGRDACDAMAGEDGYPQDGCWVPDGVQEVLNDDGEVTGYTPNEAAVLPQTYYSRISGNVSEEFVYDASFVRLRELRLSYRLPASLLRGTPVRLATISLVGRNLALLYSKVPNLDPESTYNTGNGGLGLELAGVPQTRSIGFNLNVRL